MKKVFSYRIEDSAGTAMKQLAKESGISLNKFVEKLFQKAVAKGKTK